MPGELEAQLRTLFSPTDGSVVPRRVDVDLPWITGFTHPVVLTLVQDASVGDPSQPGQSAATLLALDLEAAQAAGPGQLYLACINRGVLDDASIVAAEQGRHGTRALLDAVARAVSLSPSATSCWPLAGYLDVAIWPMDVESLLERPSTEIVSSPAAQVLQLATAAEKWPAAGTCAAGERCPFCRSRALLAGEPHRGALLRILRWYELATGKRWSFRDLFSLTSFLLAGAPEHDASTDSSPCEWAAKLWAISQKTLGKVNPTAFAAPFVLMGAQYQHVIFSRWPRLKRAGIMKELRELKLHTHVPLLRLHYFLTLSHDVAIPATLKSQLDQLCDTLDPAEADPDLEVDVSAKTRIALRDVDARFSHSVRDALQFIRKYQVLSRIEIDVLELLADCDDTLGAAENRRHKPAVAARLQAVVRDISCRIVRRNLGARTGVVRDVKTLHDFEQVVQGDPGLMYQSAKQVQGLLNIGEHFITTLNTTFGEPLPPQARRVVLKTPKQKVRSVAAANTGRPTADLKFLEVGPKAAAQHIPLTYELFRAVQELQAGMVTASLPGTVVAALDAARARLAGHIVRDEVELDGAEIRIGVRDEVIVREMQQFLVRKGGAE